jgi:hypothetical protein
MYGLRVSRLEITSAGLGSTQSARNRRLSGTWVAVGGMARIKDSLFNDSRSHEAVKTKSFSWSGHM